NETYTSETEFNPGDGYWLYFDSEGTQSITGQPINTLVVPLSAGWNLISGPSESVNISNAIDPDDIIVPGTLYGFNGTYVSTSDIQPGSGYWLNASSAGEVIFSTSEVAAKETNSINPLEDASLLTINGLPLYFGIDILDEELMMFSMPPLPPSNSLNGENRFFDVRFGNDRKILSGNSQVRVTGTEDDLSLYWSIKTDEDWDLVDESGNKTSLKGTGETILNNFSNRFLLQKREPIPETFTLFQNFPNPFNPVTSINYAIPEERFVTVSVYNVMGQKIVDLVNELNTAGYHNATWNSTDIHGYPVSSGVYIYTITAGDYYAVKKMILMK
ncbi:MAG TPA: T9SS type A sorting domain-containing protein, partial [Candidatus Marinimicrobia bacterium]|nr:T9SS type A sorting domain-containing protein [Candidatus Neomarinimicrobiota bacterium]